MTFVSEDRLVTMSLDALEQILCLSDQDSVRRTRSIALVLAYLASRNVAQRWPFDEFWKSLVCEDDKIRSGNLNRCLNGIYLQLGIKRTSSMMFKYKAHEKSK